MSKSIATPLIILGIVSLLLIVFVVSPLLQGIDQEAENLISQKRLLAELERKTENIKKFQASQETYQANLEKINQLFINAEEPVGFIEFLEREANNSNLSIEIEPISVKEIKTDPWPSTNFELSLIGSFSNVLRFMGKLESSPYLVSLSNLHLARQVKEISEDVNASFLMKVYIK